MHVFRLFHLDLFTFSLAHHATFCMPTPKKSHFSHVRFNSTKNWTSTILQHFLRKQTVWQGTYSVLTEHLGICARAHSIRSLPTLPYTPIPWIPHTLTLFNHSPRSSDIQAWGFWGVTLYRPADLGVLWGISWSISLIYLSTPDII